jgi:hypothetical protein
MLPGNPWLECREHLLFFSLSILSLSFGEDPFPHCTLAWRSCQSQFNALPLSKDDILSQPGQLEVLSVKKKMLETRGQTTLEIDSFWAAS